MVSFFSASSPFCLTPRETQFSWVPFLWALSCPALNLVKRGKLALGPWLCLLIVALNVKLIISINLYHSLLITFGLSFFHRIHFYLSRCFIIWLTFFSILLLFFLWNLNHISYYENGRIVVKSTDSGFESWLYHFNCN